MKTRWKYPHVIVNWEALFGVFLVSEEVVLTMQYTSKQIFLYFRVVFFPQIYYLKFTTSIDNSFLVNRALPQAAHIRLYERTPDFSEFIVSVNMTHYNVLLNRAAVSDRKLG